MVSPRANIREITNIVKKKKKISFSSPASKELRRHNCILTTCRKLKKLKNQEFLTHKRYEVIGQTSAHKIEETNKQIQRITIY